MDIELNKVLLDLKIDFNKTIIERVNGSGSICNNFDLSARDFIRFSKEDFSDNSKKGLINALTNTKRAIDCQIDNVLVEFGIGFEKIDSASEVFVKNVIGTKIDVSYKLKLIQALGFAPSNLTSKVRTLRNKLEHYYKIPSKSVIEEAIEIAELFILSIESKTKFYDSHFIISSLNFFEKDILDDMKKGKYCIVEPQHFSTQISVDFNFHDKQVIITPVKENIKKKRITITPSSTLYYYFLRILNYLDDQFDCEISIKDLLKYCNHPLPEKNIKIAEYY